MDKVISASCTNNNLDLHRDAAIAGDAGSGDIALSQTERLVKRKQATGNDLYTTLSVSCSGPMQRLAAGWSVDRTCGRSVEMGNGK